MHSNAYISNERITVFVAINDKDEIELTISDKQTGNIIQARALSPGVQYDD